MTAAGGSAAGGDRGLSIGAVLRRLRADFPDVTISKIRFLEAEGLLTPARRASGYRSFSEEDVQRLEYILRAQRDRFWPLKVIRESLDAMDRGLRPDAVEPPDARPGVPEPEADPTLPRPAQLRGGRPLRLTVEEVRQVAGLDERTFAALQTFGLVTSDAGGHYDEQALAVAREAAALSAYGIEPRHLRLFKMAADREIGLVDQALGPVRHRRRHAQQDPPAQDVEAEILSRCIALHVALVRAGLRARG